MSKVIGNPIVALIFSIVYVLIPWESIQGYPFMDLQEYSLRLYNISIGADTNTDELGFIGYLTSEPIWAYFLNFIVLVFPNPDSGLIVVSQICIFVYSLYLINKVNNYFILIFLLNPMIVDLMMSQLRSVFAFSLLLIALLNGKKIVKIVFVCIASLVHTSIPIFAVVYIISLNLYRFEYKVDRRYLSLFAALVALIIAFLIGNGRTLILSAIEDRRADYEVAKNSYLYLSYWFALAIAFIYLSRNYFKKWAWYCYFAIFFLVLPMFMRFFETDGIRFVALIFPPGEARCLLRLFSGQLVNHLNPQRVQKVAKRLKN